MCNGSRQKHVAGRCPEHVGGVHECHESRAATRGERFCGTQFGKDAIGVTMSEEMCGDRGQAAVCTGEGVGGMEGWGS